MAKTKGIDFSGTWIGTCTVNGVSKPSSKVIEQDADLAIVINGMRFDLTRPTQTTIDDVDNGDKYREITVYDFQWDETKTFINTSARWLGWYLEKPGSWFGEGTGYIRFEGLELETTRNFQGNMEICRYKK